MNDHQTLPSKKQTICIILILLILSLACKSPDVFQMVYDSYFGPEETKEAEEINYSGTRNALMSTQIAKENTLLAEENNKKMTAESIQQTRNAVIMTQTGISKQSTSIAFAKAYELTTTSQAQTLAAEPRSPVIDAVRFPATITSGELAIGTIDFHDYNGDVNRVRIDAVRAERWSTMEFHPIIIKGDNNRGTIQFSFI